MVTQTGRIAALTLTLAGLSACSGSQRALDAKIQEAPAVRSDADIQSEADRLIYQDPNMTPDQKQRLEQLRASVRPKLDDLSHQELRLRTVLLEELLAPNYNQDQVALLKDRLRKIEDQRLAVTFDSVDRANTILGHEKIPARQDLLRAMLEDRVQPGERGHD